MLKEEKVLLDRAVEILNRGGIIVFPTDTVFGIGCRIDSEMAVKRVFEIKGRVREKAVPVLVNIIEMAREYAQVSDEIEEKLMKKYWPGALTIVMLVKNGKVSENVTGGRETVGLRMPDNELVLELIRRIGVPIIGTSANLSGERSVYDSRDLDPKVMELVDLVIEGKCELKQGSTVIDVTKHPWEIMRQGAVRVTFSAESQTS